MKIQFTKNPSEEDIAFLTEKINNETQEYGKAKPFAFFIKDENQNIIAGANCFLLYGSIYTDQLWVDKDSRGQGLATSLMDQVHQLGKKEKCSFAIIQTMSFQNAQSFYEKLGYRVEYSRLGYINGSQCTVMRMPLDS